ncbi:flavocytochrome c [Sutterella sp.]|uniref:FAD-dependent oxidoreductase n=1 Tax=Sutterella sp. TaxID=1981025 RepID=UPI0026DEF3FC|nr:flavocytochrome c [Sutterella sp.]MDO5531161.1 flavocytochrome c [Sutterella sp.]
MTSRRTLVCGIAAAGALGPAVLHATGAPVTDTPYDVIVLGSGAAGLAAAISAREAGAARVAILEKTAIAGGHTLVSSGMVNAYDPYGQARMARRDSPEQFFRDTFEGGGQLGDPDLISRMIDGSEDMLRWLRSCGVEFDPRLYEAYTGVFPRAHKTIWARSGAEYVTKLLAHARALGVEVHYRTRGERLLLGRTGAVEGVVARSTATNKTETWPARSVVIATGGFGASLPLRTRWAPEMPSELGTTYSPGRMAEDPSTGDGIRMATLAGAALTGMEHLMAIPFWGGRVLDYPGAEIFLTLDGDRFTDETAAWDVVFDDLARTGGTEFWVITDSRSRKGATFATKVQQGLVESAETLDELATRMKIKPVKLREVMARYNEAANTQTDPEFGRTRFLQDLSKPPFYFGRERFEVHYTCGGIAITPEAEVKREEEGIIPGLYAAGETTGGVHGSFRLGGNGLTDAFVFGRIAGANAAAFASRKN